MGVIEKLDIGEIIQFSILIVLLLTLLANFWQLRIQNRLFKAQLLKDRFQMYWKMYEPISNKEVHDLKMFPEDWIEKSKYETDYKNKENAMKKYIRMSKIYEYLAFTFKLREQNLPDPLGEKWLENWLKGLVKEKEFKDVHLYYGNYYPDFKELVDYFIHSKNIT